VNKITTLTGAFVGSIGITTATTGTCPAAGVAPSWCTGGTFASGAGDGMFNNPYGMTIDTLNNLLYISDGSNHRISKFIYFFK
jgi:hypothetical protein